MERKNKELYKNIILTQMDVQMNGIKSEMYLL
jgi:hypothetical protein